MTEKKELILQTALRKFANEGYTATSTSSIAREAGVSEGLIFRHFGNKEGLLQAILKQGEEAVKLLYADIVLETDPRSAIRKTIEMPFSVKQEEYDFWRLQFKIKWELQVQNAEKLKPLQMRLTQAFRELQYAAPEMEAQFLILYLDAISAAILQGNLTEKQKMHDFLLEKYRL